MAEKLRIILLDIETLPDARAAVENWPALSDFPGKTMRASINSVLCVGWKVLGSKQVNCINAWDYPAKWRKDINDDSSVVEAIERVLHGADVIVTHNGRAFDLKFIQTRLLKHGRDPLPKLVHIDTKNECKKNLFLLNNRLTTAAKFLTKTDKLENGGWDLWVRVHRKEKKAMRLMEAYCKQDVVTLEEVFKRIRPFVKLPNANLFTDEAVCPNCGGQDLQRRGERLTTTGRFQRYQCNACGAWGSCGARGRMKAE